MRFSRTFSQILALQIDSKASSPRYCCVIHNNTVYNTVKYCIHKKCCVDIDKYKKLVAFQQGEGGTSVTGATFGSQQLAGQFYVQK